MFKHGYYIYIPISIAAIAIIVILSVGLTTYNTELVQDADQLSSLADTYTSFVSRTVLATIINGGDNMREVYRAKPDLSRDAHYSAAENIMNRYDYIQTIGFSKRVYDIDRAAEEMEASVYFGRNISITDPGGAIAPVRPVYYPTTMQYPITNTTRIMVDRTLTQFFYLLEHGISSGQDSISTQLYFPFTEQYAHVIYYPVFNETSNTDADRINNYVGSVGIVFDIRTILPDRLSSATTRPLAVYVFDTRNDEFLAGVCGNAESWYSCFPGPFEGNNYEERNITVVDAVWIVRTYSTGPTIAYTYYLAFAIGLPISALIVFAAWLVLNFTYKQVKHSEEIIRIKTENDETKQKFIHYIFHEIRIPFQTIKLGLTNLRKYLPANEVAQNTWSALDKSITHATGILNDVLDFGKMEKGKLLLHKEYVRLTPSTSLLLANYESSIYARGIQFNSYVHPDIETRLFNCDIGRLNQCINNFLSNAQKFTPKGSITFSIDIVDRVIATPEIWNLRISVKDTGIGIKSEDQVKIFQAYQQIENQSREVGTGLGLTIVKNIVGLYKGEIGFKSEFGKGSEFWFTVPLETKPVPEDFDNTSSNEISSVPEYILECSVLIVDDNESNCFAFGEYLKNLGFDQIEYAYNGIEALEKIDQHGLYDIIFMDYNMPNMDGVECAKEISKRYGNSEEYRSYITMVTGAYVDSNFMYDIGIDNVLQKPLDLKKLNMTMQEIGKRYSKPKDIDENQKE